MLESTRNDKFGINPKSTGNQRDFKNRKRCACAQVMQIWSVEFIKSCEDKFLELKKAKTKFTVSTKPFAPNYSSPIWK